MATVELIFVYTMASDYKWRMRVVPLEAPKRIANALLHFRRQHSRNGYLKFGNICWLKLIKRRVEKFYFVNYMRKAKLFAAEVCVVEQVQRRWRVLCSLSSATLRFQRGVFFIP